MSDGSYGSSFSQEARELLASLTPGAQSKLDDSGSSNSAFNSSAFSFALSVVRAGGSEHIYLELVEGSYLGQSYRRKNLSSALEKTYADAEKAVEEGDYQAGSKQVVRELLERVLDEVMHSDLKPGVKATAEALVSLGIQVGTWAVDASTRRLGEVTGFTPVSTGKHLKEIEQTALVEQVKFNGRGRARTFFLNVNYLNGNGNLFTHISPQEDMCKVFPVLFSNHGLGTTAKAVVCSTPLVAVSPAEIAKEAGKAPKTAKTHLERMSDLGLVVRVDPIKGSRVRYCYNLLADPEQAAREVGAVEAQKEMREKHALQRESYAVHAARDLQRALRRSFYQTPEYLGKPRPGEERDYRPFRLNEEGVAQVERQGWAWKHAYTPEIYRDYAPEKPEEEIVFSWDTELSATTFPWDTELSATTEPHEKIRPRLKEQLERYSKVADPFAWIEGYECEFFYGGGLLYEFDPFPWEYEESVVRARLEQLQEQGAQTLLRARLTEYVASSEYAPFLGMKFSNVFYHGGLFRQPATPAEKSRSSDPFADLAE